jgi:hypothetical protein
MNTITATVKAGRLDLQVPPDWPDGTEVEIHPLEERTADDDGPMTPDEIARVLAAMEKVQPFEMTPEEEAEIEAHRRRNKGYTIANMHKGMEDLFP